MRTGFWTFGVTAVMATVGFSFATDAEAARIDAVRGRQYQITKRHGPWMIMVATFHAPPKDRRGEGMTPEQAADELVFELRRKGIPAYAFKQKSALGAVNTINHRTGQTRRSLTAYRGGIAVLAGNYGSAQDKVAKATLTYIKKFQPKYLSDVEGDQANDDNSHVLRLRNGGIFRSTPGRPMPFSRAFLTPNPLLTPEELRVTKKDPVLLKINSGSEFSLLKNPAKYSLVVASFYGKSMTALDSQAYQRKLNAFKVGESLDKAGKDAWELARTLRKDHGIEAWVYHDHHKSVVTVGSFNSGKDPRIRSLQQRFMAKKKKNPVYGNLVYVAEWVTIPKTPRSPQDIIKKWIFDPKPRLMMVPQYAR